MVSIRTLVLVMVAAFVLGWGAMGYLSDRAWAEVFAQGMADVPHPSFAHPGSMVIFVHYMPPYEGDPRAAMVLEYPHACPPTVRENGVTLRIPEAMEDCANLRFWTKRPDETENPTNVLDGAGLPTGEHTNNGDDWRCCVPHDPTGKVPRSWHLWGEAPGEEAR